MLTIYGFPVSGPSNKVRYTAEYLGLEYRWEVIDLQSGEGRSVEYRKLHPAGKVPVIEEDALTLFESGAICRYLCERERSELYPSDLKRRALVNQWTDFTVQHVYRAVSKVVYNRVFAPQMDREVDERSLEEGLDWLDKYIPIVNDELSDSAYFCGNHLSLAYITLISVLDYAPIGNIDLTEYDELIAWKTKMESMDFWISCKNDREEILQQMA